MHPAWAAKRAAAAALRCRAEGSEDDLRRGRSAVGSRRTETRGSTAPHVRGGDRGYGGKGGGFGGRHGKFNGQSGGFGDKTPPPGEKKKEKTPKPPKVYIGEIKGGTGEVVGKVTKPMGPSGDKDKDNSAKKGRSSTGGRGFDVDAAAAAHPRGRQSERLRTRRGGASSPRERRSSSTSRRSVHQ